MSDVTSRPWIIVRVLLGMILVGMCLGVMVANLFSPTGNVWIYLIAAGCMAAFAGATAVEFTLLLEI